MGRPLTPARGRGGCHRVREEKAPGALSIIVQPKRVLTPFRLQGRPMPSPFPGMDPYLEAHWRDVHASLIIYARDALQGVLPGSLRARAEERVLLGTPQGIGDHPLFPDVRVVEYRPELKRILETRPETNVSTME